MLGLDELLARGDTLQARAAAEFRLQIKPQDPAALRVLAKVHLLQGEVDRAQKYIAQIERGGPTVDSLLLRANAAGQRQDFTQAEQLYRSAVALPQAPAEAFFGLGLVLLQRQDVDEALNQFETAYRLKPRFGVYGYYVAQALATLGRDAQRIVELLTGAIHDNPQYPPSYVLLSKILGASGRRSEATDLLQRGLAVLPGNPHLLSALTSAALLSRDLNEAYRSAVELATAHRDDPVALANLALLLLAQHQLDLVLEICAEAKVRGKTTAALKSIEATAYLSRKPPDFERATAAYEEAMEIEPTDWRSANDFGQLLLRRDSTVPNAWVPRAVAVLEEALKRKPDQPEPKLNLAIACLRAGEKERALNLAKQLLVLPVRLADTIRDQAMRLSQLLG